MKFFWSSILSRSFWSYALFSRYAVRDILSAFGFIFLFLQVIDFFGLYTKDAYEGWYFWIFLIMAVVYAVANRFPAKRVSYKIPKKDLSFELFVGDMMSLDCGGFVISTNTTFDTDIASGIIAKDSLQGQFAIKFFDGNTRELDRQIEESLEGIEHEKHTDRVGKKNVYPVGTVARVQAHGKIWYLLAMAELNKSGTANSTLTMIDVALERLWQFIAESGELTAIAIPVIGTGRGRINLPRKKMIERIAQSFADASGGKVFCNKLVIVVSEKDATDYRINLFEIKDYLRQSLHF